MVNHYPFLCPMLVHPPEKPLKFQSQNSVISLFFDASYP